MLTVLLMMRSKVRNGLCHHLGDIILKKILTSLHIICTLMPKILVIMIHSLYLNILFIIKTLRGREQ